MKFNEKLKNARKNAKITQVELAEKLNVTQGTIANWERGAREPDMDTIKAIATALSVPVEYFFIEGEQRAEIATVQTESDPTSPNNESEWAALREILEQLPDEMLEDVLAYAEYLASKHKDKKSTP